MRSKNAFLNLLAAVAELIVATVTSFIMPQYIIREYGSNVNGLISSITQFLSYIAIIESGIGAIGRAELYKPLAEKNTHMLSKNVKMLENFYRRIAYIFIGYAAVVSFSFPLLVNNDFDYLYTAALIAIIAVSTFIQYYFGITYQTVIQADQKKYIPSLLQTLVLFLNMIITVVMIKFGAGIHAVKIGSTLAYAVRPIILYVYVRSKYKIDKNAKPGNEIFKQRWDGFAQHIAFFVHKNTDIAVLTVLTNVNEVSVYSVYMLAVSGCSKVVNIFSSSLEPIFGNMIAKGEKETLKDRMEMCSVVTVQVSIVLFSTVAIVISDFIRIYTRDITDVNYLRPVFGIVMLIAEAIYCIRLPYQSAIYAAGHFKQTRNGAVVEALMNIILSVIFVFNYGLIGVAVGTLVSMLFRTVQYIRYYYVKLIEDNKWINKEINKIVCSVLEILLIILAEHFIPKMESNNYISWFFSSCLVCIECTAAAGIVSFIFYKKEYEKLLLYAKRLLRRRI